MQCKRRFRVSVDLAESLKACIFVKSIMKVAHQTLLGGLVGLGGWVSAEAETTKIGWRFPSWPSMGLSQTFGITCKSKSWDFFCIFFLCNPKSGAFQVERHAVLGWLDRPPVPAVSCRSGMSIPPLQILHDEHQLWEA